MTLFLINYFTFYYIYFACLRLLKIILLYIDFYHSSTTSNIYYFLFPFPESIHYQLSKIEKRRQNIPSALIPFSYTSHFSVTIDTF